MRVAGQPHTRCRSVTSTHHVVQRVLGDRGYAPAKLTRTVAGGCAAGWCGRGVAREPPTPGTRARWRPGTPRVTWARTTASDAHSAKQSADAQASDLARGRASRSFGGPRGDRTHNPRRRPKAHSATEIGPVYACSSWSSAGPGDQFLTAFCPAFFPSQGCWPRAGRGTEPITSLDLEHDAGQVAPIAVQGTNSTERRSHGVEGHYGPFIHLMKFP
jgi:hypothetical protein